MPRSPRLLFPVILIAVAAIAGCGSNTSNPLTTTAPTPTVVTETFTGQIGQNGTAVYSFTVTNTGYSLLAGYTSITPASVTALGLGIGAWDPTSMTCGLNQIQNDASHSGSTAVSSTASAGAYCVRVYDAGNVAANVTASFTIQVEHY
jgi:hypothetical protein